MTGNGKIARLPNQIREKLNQRLLDGENGTRLLDWLNSLPEVIGVLKTEFQGEPILKQNLSRWRAKGFQAWLIHQRVLDQVRQARLEAQNLHDPARGPITEDLASLVAGRYALAAQRLSASGATHGKEWKALRELCHDLVSLRRGDHGAGWLRLEQERLADERKERDKKLEELFLTWANDPKVRDALCRGYVSPEERMTLLRQEMFKDVDELLKQNQHAIPPDFGLNLNPNLNRNPHPNPPPCAGAAVASAGELSASASVGPVPACRVGGPPPGVPSTLNLNPHPNPPPTDGALPGVRPSPVAATDTPAQAPTSDGAPGSDAPPNPILNPPSDGPASR